MKKTLIAAGLALSACASPQQQYDQQVRYAQGWTSPALCYAAFNTSAGNQQIARQVLAQRQFTCTPEITAAGQSDFYFHQQQVAARRAEQQRQSDAMSAAGLYLLTQPPPAVPAAPPAPVTCSSRTAWGTTTTTCN